MEIIRADNLGIMFKLQHERRGTLRSAVARVLKQDLQRKKEFWALRHVSFTLNQGETLGIIGQNGSGKSTLLRIVAGIFQPDEGTIKVQGKVSPLLSTTAGFQADLSGLDNIYLSGILLGLTKNEIDTRVEEIIGFSELEDFIDTPVKNYSSGMLARLGFAIAVHIIHDILLIDEVMGVGDTRFKQKCEVKMRSFKEQGKTIILVSHSMEAIKSFCSRAIWLDGGEIKAQGPAKEVTTQYLAGVAPTTLG